MRKRICKLTCILAYCFCFMAFQPQNSIALNAPYNLTAKVYTSQQITLSWMFDPSTQTGFIIEQAIGISGTFSTFYQVGPNETNYTITGRTANTSYKYRVRAKYGTTYSNYSNVVTVLTPSAGPNYYLNTNSPTNGTGTITSPWNSVAFVNGYYYCPGNVIYIARGTRVTGTPTQRRYYPTHPLRGLLTPNGSGSTSGSITIDAYDPLNANGQPVTGLPKPIIDAQGADNSASILLYDQECWTIQNLEVTNNATAQGFRSGICIVVDGRTGKTMRNYKIINNTIHDVYGYKVDHSPNNPNNNNPSLYDVGGIYIRVFEPDKMHNVLIQGNQVSDVVAEGICFFGSYWTFNHFGVGNVTRNWNNLNTHITIEKNLIQRTQGHGILCWGTDSGLIQHNIINGAGQEQLQIDTPTAIAGIESNFANNVKIQFNEISNTKLWDWDGGAIDVDLYHSGVGYVQYNYSHDNDGSPFEEYGNYFDTCIGSGGYCNDDDPNVHTVYRYNISYNDGIKETGPGTPGYLYNSRGRAEIYNNVFYTSHQVNNVTNNNVLGQIRNNIFILGSQSVIVSRDFSCPGYNPPGTACTHSNNLYWCSNGDVNTFQFVNITPYIKADPQFMFPVTPNLAPNCFKLKSSSPCVNTGIIITNNGGRDYWGTPVPNVRNPWIGAYQHPSIINILKNFLE